MRVISGEAKGIRLNSPPGDTTRPITDRVKESLFNILGDYIVDCIFLDLFAGTGGVGIEALSRGARSAVFVEKDRRVVKVLKENLNATRLTTHATVVCRDVFKFIKKAEQTSFDIIYIAPPQYRGLWAKTLWVLDEQPLLSANGMVIAQIFPKEFEELELHSLSLLDQRKYGSTLLCFYERAGESDL